MILKISYTKVSEGEGEGERGRGWGGEKSRRGREEGGERRESEREMRGRDIWEERDIKRGGEREKVRDEWPTSTENLTTGPIWLRGIVCVFLTTAWQVAWYCSSVTLCGMGHMTYYKSHTTVMWDKKSHDTVHKCHMRHHNIYMNITWFNYYILHLLTLLQYCNEASAFTLNKLLTLGLVLPVGPSTTVK